MVKPIQENPLFKDGGVCAFRVGAIKLKVQIISLVRQLSTQYCRQIIRNNKSIRRIEAG